MDLTLRIAPGVRLASTTDGLRVRLPAKAGRLAAVDSGAPAEAPAPSLLDRARGLGRGLARVTDRAPGRGRGADEEEPGPPERVVIAEVERQAVTAQRHEDVTALHAIEGSLVRRHLALFPQWRKPVIEGLGPMTEQERADARRRALRSAVAGLPLFGRAVRRAAHAEALEHADEYVRASHVARLVVSQHRQAVVDETWNDLADHDPATVIEAVERAFARSATDCTCVDAGTVDGTPGVTVSSTVLGPTRNYVTVILTFAGIGLVGERGPGVSPTGRKMMRRRTHGERNALYLTALASTVLACVKQVLGVAVGADDVCVVVVRPREGAARALEPVYVGVVSREAVTLRPPQADPVPLLLSAAVREMRFDGPAHDLLPIDVDDELDAVLGVCEAARTDGSDGSDGSDASGGSDGLVGGAPAPRRRVPATAD